MSRIIDKIDVICQHKADGTIIPLRFRLMNEDGEYETHNISSYRLVSYPGVYTTPDGIMLSSYVVVFECQVVILDYHKVVRLYFDKKNCAWRMAI